MFMKIFLQSCFGLLCFCAAQAGIVEDLKNLKINDATSYMYLAYSELTPGQLRYSALNVQEKVNAALKKNNAWKDEKSSEWHYKFNNDTSIIETPLPVIIAPFGPVLVDGHHDTLASIELKAPMIPVFVMADFSDLSEEQFWNAALKNGLVYPYTLDNEYKIPQNFSQLQDDPNRFFAALVARKCTKNKETGEMVAIASPKTKLADHPVWIKFGNEIPFIEFKISDVLKKYDLFYKNSWGENVSEEFVEKAREILVEHAISGLKVIPERIKVTDESELARTLCIRE